MCNHEGIPETDRSALARKLQKDHEAEMKAIAHHVQAEHFEGQAFKHFLEGEGSVVNANVLEAYTETVFAHYDDFDKGKLKAEPIERFPYFALTQVS